VTLSGIEARAGDDELTRETDRARVRAWEEPQSGTRSAQVSRTFREVVSAYATADLADELIHEALADAGLRALPERADVLRELIEVELRHAVLATLGPDAAEAVVEGLEPMLEVLDRMDQRRSAAPRESAAPRSGPSRIARVAILTEDPRLAVRVRVGLGAGQELARYRSLDELAERGRIHASVIIDCRPFDRLGALVASATEARTALARTDILLLFADVAERSALRSACPMAGVIVCSSRDVDDAELAELLGTFVGTG
jgi:hypothetical protein